MNALYGIFQFDSASVERAWIDALADSTLNPNAQAAVTWYGEGIALGARIHATTPEARFESFPLLHPAGALVLFAAARLDNRPELCDTFHIPDAQRAMTPDSRLMLYAYEKWERECPAFLVGDWAMVVWDNEARELFLARDHHGNTGLFYYYDRNHFAFTSSLKPLLTLPFVPRQLNELFVAKTLTAWATDGVETAYRDVHRLPPAHTLLVSANDLKTRRYWFPEHAADIRFKHDADYVAAVRDIFVRAVSERLRVSAPLAATLSGGLDSGSVSAFAARQLAQRGKVLTTYTSIPLMPTQAWLPPQLVADESPFAEQTSRFAGNMKSVLLSGAEVSPLAGIRQMLEILGEPAHAAGNYFWIVSLLARARREGNQVLLSGQGGNGTISWSGLQAPALSHLAHGRFAHGGQALRVAYFQTGLWRTLRTQIAAPVIQPVRALYKSLSGEPAWRAYSAIHPAFAERIALSRRMKDAGHDANFKRTNDPRRARFEIVQPGRSTLGTAWQDKGAAFDLEIRDPTVDKRLMEFCFGIPEEQYLCQGRDRMLMRRAMEGYLPDVVRLNTRRGLQAADLGYRLTQHRSEMEESLTALRASPLARSLLDLEKLQTVWTTVQARLDFETTIQSQTILTRGVMTGLFLLTFD